MRRRIARAPATARLPRARHPGRPPRSRRQQTVAAPRSPDLRGGGYADLTLAVGHRLRGSLLVLLLTLDPQRLTGLRVGHRHTLAAQTLDQLGLAVHVVAGLRTIALLRRRELLARLLRRLDLRRVTRIALDLQRLARLGIGHLDA